MTLRFLQMFVDQLFCTHLWEYKCRKRTIQMGRTCIDYAVYQCTECGKLKEEKL